jgi:decaprenylphospho-beta-D-erythro-pentofuranosid-2-ulose 2-reductase
MKKVLIIGATSAIAEATARLFARRGDRLFLVARNRERLQTLARDLTVRGAESASFETLDVNDLDRHQGVIDAAIDAMGGMDIALIAHGTLPDQKACENDVSLTIKELNTNAVSTLSLLTLLANRFEQAGHGCIACISSVAGDRGRQSNYVYGAAKGAVSVFMQGLRNRLATSGVHVLTIKPGFVDTPMTTAFKKSPLWSNPQRVARSICSAIDKGRDVIYVPWFWFPLMLVIRAIPERLFKRLSL